MPSDAASRAFVEDAIHTTMQTRFSGIEVTLEDNEFKEITPLRPGSYLITITPLFEGGPSATYTVSKSSTVSSANIVKISSAPGQDTEETLELQWLPNEKMKVRKTGPFHDGQYLVDFNLKNFSTLPAPVIPSDNATKSYVDETLKSTLDVKFGGVKITLKDMDYTPALALRPGSYLLNISPLFNGGPTGTYSISKSSGDVKGMVTRITSCPGLEEGCQLEVEWPESGKVRIRKTNPYHDGDYLIDTGLKNFTSLSEVILPTDQASKAYVDAHVRENMDIKFSGVNVHLEDDELEQVIMLRPGSYVVTVSADILGAPTAVFNISKSSTSAQPSIIKTSSCPGEISEEQLELLWPPNSKLLLRKTGSRYAGLYTVDFNMKNFSNIPPPILPNDSVSKEYLDKELRDRMDVKFGGIKISLKDTDFTNVLDLRQGSYFVTVSPLMNGGPTGAFLISKGGSAEAASVVKMTSCPGRDTGETLELVWLANRKLQLRKTGVFHDGDYLVDMNLKNYTNIPPPVLPTDVADKSFVEETISNMMDVKFSGISVTLEDTNSSAITALKHGSYMITVSGLKEGMPTGTFMVSKASNENEGSIVNITSCPGVDSGELLSVIWPPNSKILLKKSGIFHDGMYLVDFNLKNFTNNPPPTLPGDVATLRYVEKSIKDALDIKFGGIIVDLKDLEYTSVTALKPGSYIVTITGMQEGFPTATYTLSKSSTASTASVVKISSCPGTEGEDQNLELVWNPNSKIKVRKTGFHHNGQYLVDFNLKNFSNTPSPELPSDIATKSFVETLVKERMEAKFSGIVVPLKNDEISDVTVLKNGSYIIAVSPLDTNGGATATFNVSKNDLSIDAHIVKVSSCPGVNTGELLELFWPAYGKLQLKKTNSAHDGNYLVDFSLKNFSNLPPPIIPSDSASKEYVDVQIQKYLQMRFSGISVNLEGIEPVDIVHLKPGAYVIGVSATFDSGPMATFAITKSGAYGEPSIVRLTSSPGGDTGEQLSLVWESGKKLQLSKSGPGNDGSYVIDMNLKNIAAPVRTILPSVGGSISEDEDDDIVVVPDVRPSLNKGISILLDDNLFTDVIALKPGSYVLTVSGDPAGSPTATFSISKSSAEAMPSIVKITSSPASNGEDQVEIAWGSNEKVKVRKTGLSYNGMYRVDTSLKNISIIDLPEGNVSGSGQPVKMGNIMQYEFILNGTEETRVSYMLPGCYMAFLSSFEANMLSATFSLMKKSDDTLEGVSVPMTLVSKQTEPYLDMIPEITIRWDANNVVFISKSSETIGDGVYFMKVY